MTGEISDLAHYAYPSRRSAGPCLFRQGLDPELEGQAGLFSLSPPDLP